MKTKTNKVTNQNKNIKKDDKKEKLDEKKNQENKNVLDENDKKKKREAAAVKMLKCEFCQNPIPDSKKTLNFSCQHQLCGVCISHCIFRDNFKCITERNDLVTLRCNECLKRKSLEVGSAQVQISFILTLLKDTYKIRNKKKRDICLNHKKEADYCPICKKWICEECKKQFHNTNFPSHSFFTTEEPFSFKRCRKHGDKGLELFCNDCGVDICSSCSLKGGDHSSHNVISMVELKKRILKGKKKYKYQNMDEFDDVLQKLQIEFKNRFEKSYKQKSELISEITTLLQTFYDQFFAYKEKMENFIENYFKIIRACYFNYFKDIEEKEPRINSLEFIDSVDREISHFDFDSKYTAELEKIKNDLSLIKARKFFEYKLRFIHHSFQCINTMKDTNIEYKKDKKGQKLTEIKNQIYCLIQLKNGNVLTGGSKGILNIWDINTGKKVDSFKAHKGNIYSVIELNDGRLASSGGDSWIKIWDIKNEDDTNLEAKTIDLIPKKPIEKVLNPVSMEKPSIIIKKDDNESLIKNNNDINTNTNNLINNNWNNKTTVNEINTTNLVQINQDNEKMKLNAHPKNLIVPENENTGYNSNMNMANMINSGLNNQPQIQVSQNPPNVSYAGNGIAFEHPKDVAYGSSGVSQAQNNQLSGQPYYNFNMNDNNIQNLGNSTINQNNISDLASQSFGKNTNSTFPVVNNESNNNKEKNTNVGLGSSDSENKKVENNSNNNINSTNSMINNESNTIANLNNNNNPSINQEPKPEEKKEEEKKEEEKKEEEKKEEEKKEENYNDFDFDGIQDSSKANPPKKPDEENSIKTIEDKSNYLCKMKLHGHPSDVNCIFETSQNKIVSCGKDNYILIWSLDSPETPIKIKGHENGVGCGIELNDNTIVTGGGDKKIKIWDLRIIDQQKPYATMKGHTNAIFSICKINDEKLASASCDKSIRIWDLKNYVCTLIFEGHSGFVWSLVNLVRYNKDKNRKDSEEEVKNLLVSASSDKTIKFWDVEEKRCVKTIFAHDKEITTLGKLKDGNIISGSLDSTIKIWKI